MSFDYSGFINLRDELVRIEKGFDYFINAFLLKQALNTVARTKGNTPVDTGWLRENWFVGATTRVGDSIEITVYNNVEYASFLEYGHLNRNRTSWVPGFFMCTIAIDEVNRLIPSRWDREFNAWLATLGVNSN